MSSFFKTYYSKMKPGILLILDVSKYLRRHFIYALILKKQVKLYKNEKAIV